MRVSSAIKTATAALFLGQTVQSLAVSTTREVAVQRDEILKGPHIHLESRDKRADPGPSPYNDSQPIPQANRHLQIEIQNLRNRSINAYIGGGMKTVNGTEQVMLRTDTGQYFLLKNVGANDPNVPTPVPSTVPLNISIPANATKNVTLPDYLLHGRVWIAEGHLEFRVYPNGAFSEPSGANPSLMEYNVKWGFVELNHDAGGIIINLSFVDWVSLSLGMTLTSLASGGTNTASVRGLEPGAMEKICDGLNKQANLNDALGQHDWDKLCIYSKENTLVRVISPNIDASMHRVNSTLVDYYKDYVDKAWQEYTERDLTLNLQGDADGLPLLTPGDGIATVCRVNNGTRALTCDKAPGHSYAKPTTSDIWGCNSGPFVVGAINGSSNSLMHSRIIPRLCAAFTRSTLLLSNGSVQPFYNESQYYTNDVTNHYSRLVHKYLDQGKGYAFSYDDVNPEGIEHNAAGVLAATLPTKVHIEVKGDTGN
ncbi:hypothetical protein PFICI_12830 [Pestalotiopsis fici W106-1]|uniref:GH64 domain-containing protein n=1 Tax=Pestalotiopsis fici (strain W106-1 / CGMCC3.15140) TaxID=1229662 RepID=W3WST4_PESFW|nr:uncharacterized protein PFICI_12830 [Pestalotiopsis fici W106-1]ETS75886.1 hypothetical protein PFICI_12830 [Pestalotiopsis fici W106-1]